MPDGSVTDVTAKTMSIRKAMLLCVVGLALGCDRSQAVQSQSMTSKSAGADLVFLTRDGCLNTTDMRANLDTALRAMNLPTVYQLVDLGLVAGDVRNGYGTPTVLYKGRDLYGMPAPVSANPEAT